MTRPDEGEIEAIFAAAERQKEAERQARIAAGQSRFTDLDDEGRRRYYAERKRLRRAAQKARAERLGHTPLEAASIKAAMADAGLEMLAAGDERVLPVAKEAAKRFRLSEGQVMHAFQRYAEIYGRNKKKNEMKN